MCWNFLRLKSKNELDEAKGVGLEEVFIKGCEMDPVVCLPGALWAAVQRADANKRFLEMLIACERDGAGRVECNTLHHSRTLHHRI